MTKGEREDLRKGVDARILFEGIMMSMLIEA
jgi:hypothetical protein